MAKCNQLTPLPCKGLNGAADSKQQQQQQQRQIDIQSHTS